MLNFLKLTTNSNNPILRSRILLYIVVFIAIFNVLNYASSNDYIYLLVFLLIGYLTTFYSKNMIVVLLISIALTNILKYGTKVRVNEGLDNIEEKTKETPEDVDKPSMDKDKNKIIDNLSKISKSLNISDMGDLSSIQKKADTLVETQSKLMKNMDALEPLLKKAEGFLEKYEGMKNKLEGMKGMKSKLEEMRNKEGFRSSINYK